MKLPGAERAVVSPSKIQEYLLSPVHPVGRFKAAFFAMLGYSLANWEVLAEDLRRHAVDNAVETNEANEFGRKYLVVGTLAGPSGRSATVVTVWIVLRDEDFPRLVTSFPGGRP